MSIIIVDTAANTRWDFNDKDPLSPTQAHLIRLAVLLMDETSETINEHCTLIRLPSDAHIDPGAQRFHGISEAVLGERGVSMTGALTELANSVGVARLIVAHNWQYRARELDRSFALVGMPQRVWPESYCLQIKGAPVVGIERQAPGGGFAWPRFEDCCDKFLGRRLFPTDDPVHDGLLRVQALREFYLRISAA
jgi:DNA polymerase III epsilon subunit-like protein